MKILLTSAVFSGISTVLVALRFYTRLRVVNNPGNDDYVIAFSLVFAWCCFVFLVQEIQYGVGQPTASLKDGELEKQLKALWLSIPFYNLSLNLTKASILFLYLRIFTLTKFVTATRIITIVVLVYGVWTVFSAIFNCVPVSAFWNFSVHGHCIPRKFLWFFNAAMNIFTDLAILLLPVPVLSQLRVARRQKIGVLFVFATGGFACITSIVRLKSLTVAETGTDLSRDNGPIAMWSFIEMNMGIICACLPTLQPLVSRMFPRLASSSNQTRARGNHYKTQSTGRMHGQGLTGQEYSTMISGHHKSSSHPEDDKIFVTRELQVETSEFGRRSESGSDRGLVLQNLSA